MATDFIGIFTDYYFGSDFAEEKIVLSGIDSLDVSVYLNEDAKGVINFDRVKNKFELLLRRYNMRVSDRAYRTIAIAVEGLWDKNETFFVYTVTVRLNDSVRFTRQGKLYGRDVALWEQSSFGYAGKTVVEKALYDVIEARGESFVNAYLAANGR